MERAVRKNTFNRDYLNKKYIAVVIFPKEYGVQQGGGFSLFSDLRSTLRAGTKDFCIVDHKPHSCSCEPRYVGTACAEHTGRLHYQGHFHILHYYYRGCSAYKLWRDYCNSNGATFYAAKVESKEALHEYLHSGDGRHILGCCQEPFIRLGGMFTPSLLYCIHIIMLD